MNPSPENNRPDSWIRRNQDMVQTLAAGVVGFGLAAVLGLSSTPPILLAVALVLCLLAPFRKVGPATSLQGHLAQNLAVSFGVIAVTALAARFFFSESWAGLAFAAFWLAALLAIKVGTGAQFLRQSALPQIGRVLPQGNPLAALGFAAAAAVLLTFAGRFSPESGLTENVAISAGVLWMLLGLIPVPRALKSKAGRYAAQFIRFVLWVVVVAGLAGSAGRSLALPWLFDSGLLLLAITLASPGPGEAEETLRWVAVLAFSFAITFPLAAGYVLGSGDSAWYALTMKDVLTQVRSGVFPVFVGQSIYQFNGNYSPVRIAPLFSHLGMLGDLLTWRTLDAGGIQNLVTVACGMASGLAAYAALRLLLPAQRWCAAVLACLYAASPGVLAVMYDERLYMTWTVMPWLPLAFYGFVRSFSERSFRPYFLMAFGLGMTWWGHSPVALWLTLILALGQLPRLWRDRADSLSWKFSFGAAAVLTLVIAYPIVSVLFVPPDLQKGGADIYFIDYQRIMTVIRDTFATSLQPVRIHGKSLSDFQLGWSLGALLLVATGFAVARGSLVLRVLVGLGIFLLLFLVPIPGLFAFIWSHVPAFLRTPTGDWAMTRLMPLLMAIVVFAGAAVVARLSARSAQFFLIGLTAALAWSTVEAFKFVGAGMEEYRLGLDRPSTLLPENVALSRYSYSIFGIQPPFFPRFMHGVADPELEQRLFAADATTLLTDNTQAVLAAGPGVTVVQAGTLDLTPVASGQIWQVNPQFTLEPGHRYVLDIGFAHPGIPGILTVAGTTLSRLYQLPEYGGAEAFGSGPKSSHALPLWISADVPQAISIRFVTNAVTTLEAVNPLGSYRLLDYSEDSLPVRVLGWMPYRVRVRSPAAGWLETPKVYLKDYIAAVGGTPAATKRSTSGLTLVAVPQGESTVVLSYAPPARLNISYWVSLAAILAAIVATLTGWPRTRAQT